MSRRYVLTGAPEAGKAVVGLALAERGYRFVAEAATDVIPGDEERGVAEPWQRHDFLIKGRLTEAQRQADALPSVNPECGWLSLR